jgi:1-phosphofructokinase family hexose kinase
MIVTVTLNPVLDRTLIVPRINFDDVLRASEVRLDWAGKGLNVSRALKALGLSSTATGLLGGSTGRMLEKGLSDLQIDTDFLYIDGETRTNIVVLEADGGRHVKVNEAGPRVSASDQAAFLEKVSSLARTGDMWVFCGSLPPGIPVDYYRQLIELVQQRGALAILDTNGEMLREGLLSRPYLVKPNSVEAAEITGYALETEIDAQRAAAYFLQEGAEIVALSLGANGLLLTTHQETFRIHCPPVTARNPTGAGDALLAGIVYGLSHQLPMEQVARWGVAAGSAAAARTDTGFGDLDEVSDLVSQTIPSS